MSDHTSEPPRRRDQDRERRRWNDNALDERFRAMQDELTVLRPLPLEVARAHMRIDGLADDLGDVKQVITEFRSEYREDRDRKTSSTTARWVGGLSAAAIVLAALITAIAAILGGAP